MAWDREAYERGEGPSFGEYLRGRGSGPDIVARGALSGDRVAEGVDEQGRRFKRITKAGGTTVTETTDPGTRRQRKHVRIRLR